MPKLKTKSGAKKRFKVTATGKVMAAHAGKRHGMIKRTKKQIRQLRGTRVLFKTTVITSRNTSCRTPDRDPRSGSHLAKPSRVSAATLLACPLFRRWWGPSGHSVSEM